MVKSEGMVGGGAGWRQPQSPVPLGLAVLLNLFRVILDRTLRILGLGLDSMKIISGTLSVN